MREITPWLTSVRLPNCPARGWTAGAGPDNLNNESRTGREIQTNHLFDGPVCRKEL